TSSGGVDVREGVLALSNNDSVLSLDTSSVLWKDALGLDKKLDPVDIVNFRQTFFSQIQSAGKVDSSVIGWLFGTHIFTSSFNDAGLRHLAALEWDANTADIFDRF